MKADEKQNYCIPPSEDRTLRGNNHAEKRWMACVNTEGTTEKKKRENGAYITRAHQQVIVTEANKNHRLN